MKLKISIFVIWERWLSVACKQNLIFSVAGIGYFKCLLKIASLALAKASFLLHVVICELNWNLKDLSVDVNILWQIYPDFHLYQATGNQHGCQFTIWWQLSKSRRCWWKRQPYGSASLELIDNFGLTDFSNLTWYIRSRILTDFRYNSDIKDKIKCNFFLDLLTYFNWF